jgi:hypothetical protein
MVSVVRRMRSMVVLAAVMLISGALGGIAQAEVTHNPQFSFSGSSTPTGAFKTLGPVAVDEASGDIWVMDPDGGAIYKFDSTGHYTGMEIDKSSVPREEWNLEFTGGLAVNNSAGVGGGTVYVTTDGKVDKFDSNGKFISELTASATPDPSFNPTGLAVDGSGDLYVADRGTKAVYEFSEAGSLISQLSNPEITQPYAIAVDSLGDVYVTNFDKNVIKVEPGSSATVLDTGEPQSVAVEPSTGDVFVGETGSTRRVLEYTSGGSLLGAFGETQAPTPIGIAVNNRTGYVYVSDYSNLIVDVYGQGIVVPNAVTDPASSVKQASVVLNGTVNPDGIPVTSCEFEYGIGTAYESNLPCEQTPGSIGSGTNPAAVSVKVEGLAPGTEYHFRLAASNANGANHGSGMTFQTRSPAVAGPWAADVASTSATLKAEVDPLGISTQYRLEYGTSIPYEHVTAGNVGEGSSPVLVSYHLQNLTSSTVYHYRLVVTNANGTVEGNDHKFSTQAVGSELVLPDGRAWELVSPPEKKGALIVLDNTSQVIQAANDGNAIAYTATEPMGEGEVGHENFSEILAQRGASGWTNKDIAVRQVTPPEGVSYHEFGNGGARYDLFSQDLSSATLEALGQTPQSPEATKRTIYERDNSVGSYIPIVTAANVPEGTNFGSEVEAMRFEAATPDLSHVVFSSAAALTPTAIEEQKGCTEICPVPPNNLYEWTGGALKLVSILPDGEPVAGGMVGGQVGAEGGMSARAISRDGRWVVWNYQASSPAAGLYLRDTVTEKTVRIGDVTAQFENMSSDGSRIFYLDGSVEQGTHQLRGNLYMFDSETGTTVALTPNHGAQETGAGVENAVMGVSEDGSYVYFVARGILAQGAHSGANNLYVMHYGGKGWVTTFITILSSDDQKSWGRSNSFLLEVVTSLQSVSSRVSPNGRYLAFMSDRPLTGYDNTDAVSGQPDEEVFLYDAAQNRLACVSCDPSGARPVGQFDFLEGSVSPTFDPSGAWNDYKGTGNHWLAGFLPGWRGIVRLRNVLTTYQPRYLADSGRLFFDSPQALVPQDTNGLEDTYEYEPPGVGDCGTSNVTFSQMSGGCVNLISSGTSASESVFVDASENGDDVFFITTGKLVSGDYDTSYDIYDAHVCSNSAPCHSVSVAPPPCTSGDSCKPAPSPQPQIFGSAPSATFSGVGNVYGEVTKGSVKAKRKTKQHRMATRKRRKRRHSGRPSRSVKHASRKGRR